MNHAIDFAPAQGASEQIDPQQAPWNDPGRRIWSLYEMLEEAARDYHDLGALLTIVVEGLQREGFGLEDDQLKSAKNTLELCKAKIGKLKLSVSYEYVSNAMLSLDSTELRSVAIGQLSHLTFVIMAELKGRALFRFDADRLKYYDKPALFGDDVNLKFPEAVADIREAGSCYALERTTACVLHLMRVLDIALKTLVTDPVLGPKLGIMWSPRDNMGDMVKNLNKAATNWPAATPAEAAERTELLEVTFHFKLITEAWRNKNFHTNADYNGDQALDILRHVEGFMQHLTKLIPTP